MFRLDPLTLGAPLSATSPSDPDDVLNAKHTFNRLGYYEVPSYWLTSYPDQPLFDGIRAYQRGNNLDVDGFMTPGGETEQSVNKSLAKSGDSTIDRVCAQEAVLPGRIPDFCPLPREKERSDERRERCWIQFEDDMRKCDSLHDLPHISARRRYGRCRASAHERQATCIRGFPPAPLDTGEY